MLWAKGFDLLKQYFSVTKFELVFTHIDSLDVSGELDRSVNLYFFVGSNHMAFHFYCFGSLKSWFELSIWKLHEQMENESKCAYCRWRTWRVHISYSASISYMTLQQKVWLPITYTATYSFRIIHKIHCPIFDSFEACGAIKLPVKHPVLPPHPSRVTQCTGRLARLELVPIMSIWNKVSKVCIDMHVDDNRSVVDYIVMKILQILLAVTQPFHSGD